VAKGVGRYRLLKPGAAGGLLNGEIDGLCVDRLFGFAFVDPAREQIRGWFSSAPPGPERFQQLRGQGYIAVAIPFAFVNVNDHAVAVDVADAQPAQFRASQAGGKSSSRGCSGKGCPRNRSAGLSPPG
jgi:hypothetical protein